jgi:SAM-dependent methyltransferase
MMNPAEFANIAEAEEHFWWYRGMRRILFRLLDPIARVRRVTRALEAGCGTGFMSQILGQRYRWPMYPVDLGWEGLRHGHRLGVERLAQADIAALPFSSSAFEAVVSLDVIVHFERGKEDQPMSEFARVLAPGGLLVLRVSALDILRSRHSQFAHERQRFTRGRLCSLVRRFGIRILRATYANSLLLPIALAKFRLWEPLVSPTPTSGVRPVAGWLNRLLYLPLAAESACCGVGANFPLGQSVVLIGEKS